MSNNFGYTQKSTAGSAYPFHIQDVSISMGLARALTEIKRGCDLSTENEIFQESFPENLEKKRLRKAHASSGVPKS